jgi:hypothetical protein
MHQRLTTISIAAVLALAQEDVRAIRPRSMHSRNSMTTLRLSFIKSARRNI